MHPDLSPHLHSPECNEAIRILLACHENVSSCGEFSNFLTFSQFPFSQNKVQKFFGVCNEVNEELNRCLKREREEFRSKNKARGQAMRDKAFENQQKEKAAQ